MKKAIGIDLGGTNLKSGILFDSGQLSHLEYSPTEAQKGPKQVIKNIQDTITHLLKTKEGKQRSSVSCRSLC